MKRSSKLMIEPSGHKDLFKIPFWPKRYIDVCVTKGKKPKYRFMIYATKKTVYGEALTWWTFVNIF